MRSLLDTITDGQCNLRTAQVFSTSKLVSTSEIKKMETVVHILRFSFSDNSFKRIQVTASKRRLMSLQRHKQNFEKLMS